MYGRPLVPSRHSERSVVDRGWVYSRVWWINRTAGMVSDCWHWVLIQSGLGLSHSPLQRSEVKRRGHSMGTGTEGRSRGAGSHTKDFKNGSGPCLHGTHDEVGTTKHNWSARCQYNVTG